jgi:hypothetical protein
MQSITGSPIHLKPKSVAWIPVLGLLRCTQDGPNEQVSEQERGFASLPRRSSTPWLGRRASHIVALVAARRG